MAALLNSEIIDVLAVMILNFGASRNEMLYQVFA